jgi:hypothetical protein
MTLVAACIRESRCTTSRIHQRTQKNSVPLKEVLTSRSESVRSDDIGDTSTRSHADAKSVATIDVVTSQYRRNRLCCSTFLNCAIDDRYSIDVVATHRECQNDACTDSESQALAIKKFSPSRRSHLIDRSPKPDFRAKRERRFGRALQVVMVNSGSRRTIAACSRASIAASPTTQSSRYGTPSDAELRLQEIVDRLRIGLAAR